ncbi:restriction endonuclease subunit S [Nocardioides marmorisolisilvae]|uniref:Restriction endonuclease subunit S n=1 Tax=Nocardioides marmorisolisilvae TaxID=1542737 RepID=A0A3N0DSV9_9ACTN|nr:restriction endonuclease subunit S [Nocardioides marmorisolisilvae]RNL78483.1 restriction endonuclease subunit S [Nocardioides marmorisolisilvae]
MSLNLDKSTWGRVAFGDVVNNANQTVRDPSGSGIDRIIAMEHMDPGELRIKRWGAVEDGTTFTRRVKPGQTLFGKRRAYQRKVAYAEFDAICSGDIYTFEADESQLLGDFLPFVVQSNQFFDHALGTSAGSLSPRTNWRDLANFEFQIPAIDEQRRIADLLWALENAQQAARDLRSCLGAAHVARADVVLADVESRDGRTPLVDLVRESITDGVREKGGNIEGGVPYVRVSDMTQHGLTSEGMLRMGTDLAASNRASLMRSGDIVMALRSKIGLCHIVPTELDGCNIAQGVAKIAPDFEKVSAGYLFEVLMAQRTQSELDRVAKGTTIREVGLKALREFTLPLPSSAAERTAIVDDFRSMRLAAEQVGSEIRSIKQLQSSFSADVFGGN